MNTRKYLYWQKSEEGYVCDYKLIPAVYFVRVKAHDKQAAIKAASSLFGKVRELVLSDMPQNEAAFITPELLEGELIRALAAFEALDFEILSRIRVFDY